MAMRIATWNVNSLKARQEAVEKWLERAAPDVLLMQETKLSDDDAPLMAFAMAGYQLVHHGEGRWNGVAIAARDGLSIGDVVTNFGDGPVRDSGPGAPAAADMDPEDFDPFDEARMLAATVDGIRLVSLYAPERPRRRLAVLHRQAGLVRAAGALDPRGVRGRPRGRRAGPRRRPQRRPDRRRRLGRQRRARRHARLRARARGVPRRSSTPGLVDAYRSRHEEPRRFTWWDYRAGMFHKNFGMRIDHLLVTPAVAARVVDAEIDREARKGPPVPSDHAPLSMDLDEPGKPFDPDWDGALGRIAKRTR